MATNNTSKSSTSTPPNVSKPFPGPSNAPPQSGGVGGNVYGDKPVIGPNPDKPKGPK